jgi:hypothetical protein
MKVKMQDFYIDKQKRICYIQIALRAISFKLSSGH